jgi:hypothetical protein
MTDSALPRPIEPCHCDRGWQCEEHPGKPSPHDDCPSPGTRCSNPICPYWQKVSGGTKPLALLPDVQFERMIATRRDEDDPIQH